MSIQIQTVILNRILGIEGGHASDPIDRGGRTDYGQIEDWCKEFGLPIPGNVETAMSNFLIWLKKTHLDELCTMDDPLANVTLDSAVNTGTYEAIESLQRALGVKADGFIGPITLTKLASCDRGYIAYKVWRNHFTVCIEDVINDPLLKPLVSTTQLRFLRGWWNRCAGQITRI